MHGILEVIERDIISFNLIKDASFLISPDSYPEKVREIDEKIKAAGHQMILRYVENQYKMPFAICSIIDGDTQSPYYINGGYGCHFDKNIALIQVISRQIFLSDSLQTSFILM